jgi:hypothetical protein
VTCRAADPSGSPIKGGKGCRPRWKEALPALKIALPTTLAASESDGGLATKLTFERVIVYPDGHRHIEGVTPKQLPAPVASAAPDTSIRFPATATILTCRSILTRNQVLSFLRTGRRRA